MPCLFLKDLDFCRRGLRPRFYPYHSQKSRAQPSPTKDLPSVLILRQQEALKRAER